MYKLFNKDVTKNIDDRWTNSDLTKSCAQDFKEFMLRHIRSIGIERIRIHRVTRKEQTEEERKKKKKVKKKGKEKRIQYHGTSRQFLSTRKNLLRFRWTEQQ